MLKNIKIENVALIDKLEIDFCKNLNVLSGETGAGKSIIIDALNFVIGGKALKSLIKQGCSYMKVQAVFSCPNIKEVKDVLLDFDAYNEDEDDIIITRKMQTDGRVDTKVNGASVSGSMLKILTTYLIDIHGQHEHQKLLQDKNHLSIIDGFVKDKSLKANYLISFQKLKDINAQIAKLSGKTENQDRVLDLYSYQIAEIENAKIKPNEDDELTEKKLLMQNSEKIYEQLNSALEYLNGSNSLVENIKKASNNLADVTKFDKSINDLVERLNNCKYEVLDISSTIKEKLSYCDFNKAEYDEIDERLDVIKLIKKKYGPTLEDVFSYLNKTKEEYDVILNGKEKIKELETLKKDVLNKTVELAKLLSKERQKVAKEFETNVKQQLKDLGMKNSNFVVDFATFNEDNLEQNLNDNGCDNIKFMFSANVGQNLKPLSEIISGGEASRFMLALKNILADVDGTPSMVFDEIDTGISGEMGYMVACKMANISKKHQIMAISHLPQICAMADNNIQVYKYTQNNKTIVNIKQLNSSEILNEIARLSGGIKDNAASIEHAKELKTRCNNYKKSI